MFDFVFIAANCLVPLSAVDMGLAVKSIKRMPFFYALNCLRDADKRTHAAEDDDHMWISGIYKVPDDKIHVMVQVVGGLPFFETFTFTDSEEASDGAKRLKNHPRFAAFQTAEGAPDAQAGGAVKEEKDGEKHGNDNKGQNDEKDEGDEDDDEGSVTEIEATAFYGQEATQEPDEPAPQADETVEAQTSNDEMLAEMDKLVETVEELIEQARPQPQDESVPSEAGSTPSVEAGNSDQFASAPAVAAVEAGTSNQGPPAPAVEADGPFALDAPIVQVEASDHARYARRRKWFTARLAAYRQVACAARAPSGIPIALHSVTGPWRAFTGRGDVHNSDLRPQSQVALCDLAIIASLKNRTEAQFRTNICGRVDWISNLTVSTRSCAKGNPHWVMRLIDLQSQQDLMVYLFPAPGVTFAQVSPLPGIKSGDVLLALDVNVPEERFFAGVQDRSYLFIADDAGEATIRPIL